MTQAYQDCLEFLYSRLNYERSLMPRASSEVRIGRMRRLLRRLDDPQDALRIIHVAGTKGKGSTAMMLAAALAASGRKTGLFCSPHLHRLEERFQINGREASADDLIALTEAVRPVVSELDATGLRDGRRGPTFFEVTTAMGLLHFAREKTDSVVLEVGLGGRLDSTNAIRPSISVLTSISFDHTRQLGNTLAAIASEKAGIIKRRLPVVSGVRGDEARATIRRVANQRLSPLREVDSDFSYQYHPPSPPLTGPVPGDVSVQTWRTDWGTRPVPLIGPHQAHNLAVALATLDALADQGLDIGPATIDRAFSNLSFPARFEILGRGPWLVVDGAHNVASAEVLAQTLLACMPASPRTLVFGTTREKDLGGQLRALTPLFDRFIATSYLENPRAAPPEEVAAAIKTITGTEPLVAPSPASALDAAIRLTPRHGLVCVTGSLFLAAEARSVVLRLPSTRSGALSAP